MRLAIRVIFFPLSFFSPLLEWLLSNRHLALQLISASTVAGETQTPNPHLLDSALESVRSWDPYSDSHSHKKSRYSSEGPLEVTVSLLSQAS